MTWIRAVAAAVFSILLPGAGHALLRDWLRALLFGGLFLSGMVVFFPTGEIAAAGSVTDAMAVVNEETDTIGRFALSFIVLFAAIDATFRALGVPPSGDGAADGPSCPYCGKELDEDLEFCHWCTTRLEPERDADES